MSWAKLDDRFPDNKKVASLSNSAFRLHVTALCYAADQLTDGFLATGVTRRIGWASDDIQKDIQDLLDVQLWEPAEGGYVIHDYLEYNPTREQVEQTRAERALAGARGGQAKAANFKQKSSKLLEDSLANSLAKPLQNSAPYPVPIPSSEDEDAQAPARKIISAAYAASSLMLTKTHQDAHLGTIVRLGLPAWEAGWQTAKAEGKQNIINYVIRCAESAHLAATTPKKETPTHAPNRTNGQGGYGLRRKPDDRAAREPTAAELQEIADWRAAHPATAG